MTNFLHFINEDIEAKKTLFSTMPTKTKRDIKKFNEKVVSVSEKYDEYKARVKKYIDTKSKSFSVKKTDKNIDKLSENVSTLEHVKFILNPSNTYFEKMGFDKLLYKISNYYDFNFNALNEVLNQFLDKFELVGIKLSSDDFTYTCYVNEYMSSFLEIRNKQNKDYNKISEIFEKIYWVNPEIIEHIELNFRKLINKHQKRFNDCIVKLQSEVMLDNKISSYEDCLRKLNVAYIELNTADQEDIYDIIDLAKKGAIDINDYFENSRVRTSTYSALMVDPLNLDDSTVMDKFYRKLEKLESNIEEYNNYIKFMPLMDYFRSEYEKKIQSTETSSNKNPNDNLKNVESQIAKKEIQLDKINKKIFTGKSGLFSSINTATLKQLKIESVKLAKELYELYNEYDQEYFNEKVLSVLSPSMMVSELLHLYYSFDYFKEQTLKKVFNITTYDEMVKYSESFDLFAMNPTNIIIKGIAVFEKDNVDKVIMNKYRLDNINLTEENLDPDNLGNLLGQIQMLLRVNKIEKSQTSVDKIWFMTQVEKINVTENKKKQETSN